MRILLVEDDLTAARGLVAMLKTAAMVTDAVDTGQEALEMARLYDYDIILLDLVLPDMEGYEVVRRLRASRVETPVLILSGLSRPQAKVKGFGMGADDFIKKPFSQRLLVERVKSILRRSAPRDGTAPGTTSEPQPGKQLIERGNLVMDEERHTCTWKGQRVTLTVTEFLILQALAHRPGVVKSRNALMDAAYDDQVYVDDRTIDSHIKRLRKKFKVTDTSFDMIETLYGVGYRFKEG